MTPFHRWRKQRLRDNTFSKAHSQRHSQKENSDPDPSNSQPLALNPDHQQAHGISEEEGC